MKVYVVTSTVGEYSDWSMSVDRVFRDQGAALTFALRQAREILDGLDEWERRGNQVAATTSDNEDEVVRVAFSGIYGWHSNWEAQITPWEVE